MNPSKTQIEVLVVVTSQSVAFEISKKPFAENLIFVIINCYEKLSSCFNNNELLDNLCKYKEMVLYSLEAELQEQKIPISDVKGGRHNMTAAEKK